MKLEAGKVFSIEKENQPLKGCTVSKELEGGRNPILIFSMDRNTDISPEIFSEHKFLILHAGDLEVYGGKSQKLQNPTVLSQGESILCKVDEPVGM